MNQLFYQFLKDFRSVIWHPVFFLIAGVCALIWGFSFPREMVKFASRVGVSPFDTRGGGYNIHETVFQQHLSLTHLLLLFTIPILTMRLIAEEKKTGSFEWLLSVPITSTKIVMGKYMAAFSCVVVLLLLSLLLPLSTLVMFKNFSFNVPHLLSAYLAVALLAMVYTAIGLFSSSLTRSAVLSAFMGLAFSVALHFIRMESHDSPHPFLNNVISYLSLSRHLGHFFRGYVSSGSVMFFLILTGFFIFLTQRSIEAARGELK